MNLQLGVDRQSACFPTTAFVRLILDLGWMMDGSPVLSVRCCRHSVLANTGQAACRSFVTHARLSGDKVEEDEVEC
jgi:hypothetical protein